jgi:hypothetical protein
MTKCSRWFRGNNQAGAAHAPVPGPGDLKADIEALENGMKSVNKRHGGGGMEENISSFLERLGFPLHNTRWSWGARSISGVLLGAAWEDDLDEHRTGRFVRVLGWLSQEHSRGPA